MQPHMPRQVRRAASSLDRALRDAGLADTGDVGVLAGPAGGMGGASYAEQRPLRRQREVTLGMTNARSGSNAATAGQSRDRAPPFSPLQKRAVYQRPGARAEGLRRGASRGGAAAWHQGGVLLPEDPAGQLQASGSPRGKAHASQYQREGRGREGESKQEHEADSLEGSVASIHGGTPVQ